MPPWFSEPNLEGRRFDAVYLVHRRTVVAHHRGMLLFAAGTLPWLLEADHDVVAEMKTRATAEDLCGAYAHPELVEFIRKCCKNDHRWKPHYEALAAPLKRVPPPPSPLPRGVGGGGGGGMHTLHARRCWRSDSRRRAVQCGSGRAVPSSTHRLSKDSCT